MLELNHLCLIDMPWINAEIKLKTIAIINVHEMLNHAFNRDAVSYLFEHMSWRDVALESLPEHHSPTTFQGMDDLPWVFHQQSEMSKHTVVLAVALSLKLLTKADDFNQSFFPLRRLMQIIWCATAAFSSGPWIMVKTNVFKQCTAFVPVIMATSDCTMCTWPSRFHNIY